MEVCQFFNLITEVEKSSKHMSPEQNCFLLARQKAAALNSTRNYERNYE